MLVVVERKLEGNLRRAALRLRIVDVPHLVYDALFRVQQHFVAPFHRQIDEINAIRGAFRQCLKPTGGIVE